MQVNARFEQVDVTIRELADEMNNCFEKVNTELADIKQTQRLILKLLDERLK